MDNTGSDGTGFPNNSHRGIGRGRGRGSGGKTENKPLRRPQDATAAAPATESAVNAEVVKNSKLSASAKEFVPQSYNPTLATGTQSSYSARNLQDRIQLARQGQSTQSNYQRRHQSSSGGHYQHSQYSGQQSHGQQMMYQQQYEDASQYQGYNYQHGSQDFGYKDGGSGDYVDKHQTTRREINHQLADYEGTLRHLDHVMKTLTLDPGRFDALLIRLVNNLKPYLDQPSQSQEIASMIVQQSINETNFRYSGARICTSLVAVTPSEVSPSIFKNMLLTRCQEQTDMLSTSWQQAKNHSDMEEKQCHGLILFLAELVIQMESVLAVSLGKLLVQLISGVLMNPTPNSAKNICQALKLAGPTLENDSSSKKEMEFVMQKLTKLVTEGRVDSHVGRMVQGVNNLRNDNWGNSVKNETEINTDTAIQQSNEPVFYGPDGNILSAEESKFLQELAESTPELEDDTDLENEMAKWDDEEDEIASAYEEFLNISNNTCR
ncbi:polyadenylate-binding protein-interacting protein 1 isoform X2 [Leptopilina boulardi]|uniref:polyadenylate-binding protein-interacting protein 1 isoform X2 n=1 Tax=Leptopilina boulardi TaxID=63433 RepID=UPI0021F61313|nr:polyadenylate-binding protein-interacting protein 1 isoform X2 [Leptopilina boulardi]